MHGERAIEASKGLLLFMVLAVHMTVNLSKIHRPRGPLKSPSQIHLLYRFTHSFTSRSINTHWTDVFGSERQSDLPKTSNDKTETCLSVKSSGNYITQIQDLLGLSLPLQPKVLNNFPVSKIASSSYFLHVCRSVKLLLNFLSFYCFHTRLEGKFIFSTCQLSTLTNTDLFFNCCSRKAHT